MEQKPKIEVDQQTKNNVLLDVIYNWNKFLDIDLVKVILASGADVNTRNEDGNTPLMLAADTEDSIELIDLLIKAGADVNAVDNDGWTPLLTAVVNDNLKATKVLLDHGANINAINSDLENALIIAVKLGDSDSLIELLIKHGANINAKDKNGLTALMFAIAELYDPIDKIDKVKLLIRSGVDLDEQDNSGKTALIHAAIIADATIIETLLAHGADMNIMDKHGFTAFDYALDNTIHDNRKNQNKIIKILKSYRESKTSPSFSNYLVKRQFK